MGGASMGRRLGQQGERDGARTTSELGDGQYLPFVRETVVAKGSQSLQAKGAAWPFLPLCSHSMPNAATRARSARAIVKVEFAG